MLFICNVKSAFAVFHILDEWACRNPTTLIVDLPRTFIDSIRDGRNTSVDDEGDIKHYHLVIYKHTDGKVTLLLSKPYLKEIDISQYVVADI